VLLLILLQNKDRSISCGGKFGFLLTLVEWKEEAKRRRKKRDREETKKVK
jgi:hypothetical protein